jgi:hypothetical protein
MIGAILGIGSAILGGIGAASQNSSQQQQIDNQYRYDQQKYQFDWNTQLRNYDYLRQDTKLQRGNIREVAKYQDATNQRDYAYSLAIRDYDFKNQQRQFNESERIYGLQLGFNNQAQSVAYEAENRRMQEILTGMAFEQQDMLVKMLQEEGQLQAMGTSGRSAGKALASAMASYGRNQAIMAESLVSANKESKVSRRQIDTEKYGADLAAQSRRMLQPLKAPAPFAPLAVPRARLQMPLKPKKGPKPIKGTNTSGGALNILTSAANAGLSAYSTFAKPKSE